ncbi:LPS export ABC transporter periplasmic protein LptC [Rhodoferax sp. TS-BS-61-7]|uniref:LPS export ABC transporter periplasmic protein LptC n=1 Tax=Rhodoferax sp. TS-BS-61-7 TaxID=2094194 RepID=UPI000CF67206|nr:LPS export ABC transporter periplasmic protein LptC [Rhodoferax sp. TS-BS-61-7]PQA79393.1 LPS export ABC transporter periplasmic protein LptC [Rhodoferax sp. TS-BS-61-7]
MKNFLYEAWERFLLYLPLMVMGTLALGTYWLVRSTPVPEVAQAERVRGHEPDYFMHGFSIKTYDATGRMRSEVQGDVARHYPDTKWIEIDSIRIRSFDAQGRLTTASALRGLTNDSGSEVQLMGKAVVVREADNTAAGKATPRMEYRGEFLHAFMDTEMVKSHQPVELTRGKDRFTADAMEFDNVDQVMQLRGRVRGTLVPESR